MTDYTQLWKELGLDVPLHEELLRSVNRTFQQTVGAQVNRPQGMSAFDLKGG